MNDTDTDALKKQLDDLQLEHRDLDDVIEHLIETRPFDQLQIQRLKKRKLSLKDQIRKLEKPSFCPTSSPEFSRFEANPRPRRESRLPPNYRR